MNIRDHGEWELYQPQAVPEQAPPNTLFARRKSDGVDWYDYVNSGENFVAGSIKLTTTPDYVVGAATTDATRLFPGNGRLLEITAASFADPQKELGQKIYDPVNKLFKAPPPILPADPMADLLKRIEALEGKT